MDKELFRQYGGSTPEFSLNNLQTYARVVSVYDGDTMHIVLPIFDKFFKFNARMCGIDTCEIKSKNQENKDLAIKARNRLLDLVSAGASTDATFNTKKDVQNFLEKETYLIWVHCLEFDKYGRVLIRAYSSQDSIKSFSDILIEEKLAYKYEGDTKLTEEDQVKLLKN